MKIIEEILKDFEKKVKDGHTISEINRDYIYAETLTKLKKPMKQKNRTDDDKKYAEMGTAYCSDSNHSQDTCPEVIGKCTSKKDDKVIARSGNVVIVHAGDNQTVNLKDIHCGRCGGVKGCPGIVHDDFKQALKQAVMEAIGEDEDWLKMDFTKGRDQALYQLPRNRLRAEIRKRVEKLFE